MSYTFDKNGVMQIEIPKEHMQRGLWLIGDKPTLLTDATRKLVDPGEYPGLNDGKVMVKYWWARHPEYSGGNYPIKDRTNNGAGPMIWEMVAVLLGKLELRFHTPSKPEKVMDRSVLYPGSPGVIIPPRNLRSWCLQPDCSTAAGVTLCSTYDISPMFPTADMRYELSYWMDGSQSPTLEVMEQPQNLKDWRFTLVVPIQHEINFVRGKTMYTLRPNAIAFLDRSRTSAWGCFSNYEEPLASGFRLCF